jgi:hypothetical protein
MTDQTDLLELIERGNDAHPVCECGTHTIPNAHDGAIWIECATLTHRPSGRLRRALSVVTQHMHTRIHLVDTPVVADEAPVSAAA